MLNTFLKAIVVLVLISVAFFIYKGMTNKETVIVTAVDVEAPPEFVFEYIEQPEKTRQWISGMKSIELISGEPMTPGSRYLVVFEEGGKEIPMTEVVTDFVPNEQYAFDLENEFVNAHIDISVEAAGEGSRVVETNTFAGVNFIARAMTGMFKKSQVKRQQEVYNELKLVAEEAWANREPVIEVIEVEEMEEVEEVAE